MSIKSTKNEKIPVLLKIGQKFRGNAKEVVNSSYLPYDTIRYAVYKQVLKYVNIPNITTLSHKTLAYAGLGTSYPILLFLTFGLQRFIPDMYEAACPYPHDSLVAGYIDRLAEMIITKNDGSPLNAASSGLSRLMKSMLSTGPVHKTYKLHATSYKLQVWHSINCQPICDSDGRFLDVYANWPGWAHDSRVLAFS
uniref:DDE Tnp4 domain-containing protein n=1 Tax=Romanomermis culicivorax TaxID=13658 RepID=A0A915HZ50_ROMCU